MRAEAIVPILLPQPQIWQTSAISEISSTWLTLFDPPWRLLETQQHPTYRPTQASFPYEWLVLAPAVSKKQQLASVSPRPGTSSSQISFTAWLCQGISNPAQVAAFSDCFIAQEGWPWENHRWGLTLACTTQETPGPAHPRSSYRPP